MTRYFYELYTVKPNAPPGRATAIAGGELSHNGEVSTLAELARLAGERAILFTGYQEAGGPRVFTQDFVTYGPVNKVKS